MEAPTELPVTAPAQVEVVPTQVEEPLPVTEIQEIETPPPNEAVPQSEWQKAQERLRQLENKANQSDLEKFETKNPIVHTQKYKDKWAEVLKLKGTKGHKYEKLEYDELLNLIRDVSIPPEPAPIPTPVPILNPSAAPVVPKGEINKTVEGMLSMRYTKEQIDATKR